MHICVLWNGPSGCGVEGSRGTPADRPGRGMRPQSKQGTDNGRPHRAVTGRKSWMQEEEGEETSCVF